MWNIFSEKYAVFFFLKQVIVVIIGLFWMRIYIQYLTDPTQHVNEFQIFEVEALVKEDIILNLVQFLSLVCFIFQASLIQSFQTEVRMAILFVQVISVLQILLWSYFMYKYKKIRFNLFLCTLSEICFTMYIFVLLLQTYKYVNTNLSDAMYLVCTVVKLTEIFLGLYIIEKMNKRYVDNNSRKRSTLKPEDLDNLDLLPGN